jgi:glyoxylase-like metal-dependent hydrolase (beta-lactamase superfamily II)
MRITNLIHQITTPTPFPTGAVNCYVIKDDPVTLIDSGLKMNEPIESLRSGLAEIGLRFADIKRLLITHSHLDHYGMMATIAAEGCPKVYAHPLEVYDIENPEGYSDEDDHYRRTERFLLDSGLPRERLASILMRHPVFRQLRDPIIVTDTVEDGDRIPFEHGELLVIHCPGHSPGMLNFYDAAEQVLFSGDNLLKHISPVPLIYLPRDPSQPRANSLASYIASIKRLKAFAIRSVLPGHGEIIHNIGAVIDSMLLHHETRKRAVFAFLDGSPKTAYDVCLYLFPEISEIQIYLGMSEAVGHLDLLEAEKLVEPEKKNGKNYFRRMNTISKV